MLSVCTSVKPPKPPPHNLRENLAIRVVGVGVLHRAVTVKDLHDRARAVVQVVVGTPLTTW